MVGQAFNRRLKAVLGKCGYCIKDFSSHSFRRGSAVWAIQCGLPTEMVKFMGDWKSSAYLNYVDSIPRCMVEVYSDKFCANLPKKI